MKCLKVMRASSSKKLLVAVCLLAVLLLFTLNIFNLSSVELGDPLKPNAALLVEKHRLLVKKDWHDYAAMERDAARVGLGEHGEAAAIEIESLRDLERKMSLDNGYNELLSDSISVNRSVPDVRYKGCRHKKYLAKLPTVSAVIPFYNENFSVLLRTIHSIINRSPPELIKEIILVDDFSDRSALSTPLDDYVAKHLPKVQIVRLKRRSGLILARLAGAEKATGDVLIIIDSHMETNYNWLPPLLEPITLDKRVAVCSLIDVINHKTFSYQSQGDGGRYVFDWNFDTRRLPLLPSDLEDRTKPFRSPVMVGNVLAISREFFWELGGYDHGLDIWGGEQYELSFKIWMCGGEMLNAPCSRVAHIYRGPRKIIRARKIDYKHRNYKRVAEVWMDEYSQYLYKRGYGLYERIDAGDLTEQKALRTKLRCKSFKWFMQNIAYDLVKEYPLVDPPVYAQGAIRSVGAPTLCIDKMQKPINTEVELFWCARNLTNPGAQQYFTLSGFRDLRLYQDPTCLDVVKNPPNGSVETWNCHGHRGNQYWYYDRRRQWLMHDVRQKHCLEAFPVERKVHLNVCDEGNLNMKWKFPILNNTALDLFDDDVEGDW